MQVCKYVNLCMHDYCHRFIHVMLVCTKYTGGSTTLNRIHTTGGSTTLNRIQTTGGIPIPVCINDITAIGSGPSNYYSNDTSTS